MIELGPAGARPVSSLRDSPAAPAARRPSASGRSGRAVVRLHAADGVLTIVAPTPRWELTAWPGWSTRPDRGTIRSAAPTRSPGLDCGPKPFAPHHGGPRPSPSFDASDCVRRSGGSRPSRRHAPAGSAPCGRCTGWFDAQPLLASVRVPPGSPPPGARRRLLVAQDAYRSFGLTAAWSRGRPCHPGPGGATGIFAAHRPRSGHLDGMAWPGRGATCAT